VSTRGPTIIDFDLINEQIEALEQLGEMDEVSEGQSYDFSIRWGTALAGRLRRLLHHGSQSALNEVDERRFQSLCDELRRGLSELIDRFELTQRVFTDPPAAKAKLSQFAIGGNLLQHLTFGPCEQCAAAKLAGPESRMLLVELHGVR
jgi:hypothetical protein